MGYSPRWYITRVSPAHQTMLSKWLGTKEPAKKRKYVLFDPIPAEVYTDVTMNDAPPITITATPRVCGSCTVSYVDDGKPQCWVCDSFNHKGKKNAIWTRSPTRLQVPAHSIVPIWGRPRTVLPGHRKGSCRMYTTRTSNALCFQWTASR